jgi:anti-sigma B factor antagonist
MSATTIELTRQSGIGVIRIGGDVTSGSEDALMTGYAEAIADGARAVVLDFSALDYLNSGGIGLLVTLLVRAQRGNVRLLAAGLSDHYRQILSLTRLDEAIAIHDDVASAVAAVSGAGSPA